jgi:hypothetical protein
MEKLHAQIKDMQGLYNTLKAEDTELVPFLFFKWIHFV